MLEDDVLIHSTQQKQFDAVMVVHTAQKVEVKALREVTSWMPDP